MWRSAHLKEGWRRADGALSAITGMAEISRCERGQRTDGGHWGKSTSVWIIQAGRKLQGRLCISPERTDKNNNPPDCLHMQTNRLQLEFKDRLKEMWLGRWLVFVIFLHYSHAVEFKVFWHMLALNTGVLGIRQQKKLNIAKPLRLVLTHLPRKRKDAVSNVNFQARTLFSSTLSFKGWFQLWAIVQLIGTS